MKPLHVLVVEDLAPLRRRIVDVLGTLDAVHVRSAGTVEEATQALDREPLHGALVDRSLPDGVGDDILLDVAERHPGAARVLMTGNGTKERGVSGTGVLVVEKPFSVDWLQRWVEGLRTPTKE